MLSNIVLKHSKLNKSGRKNFVVVAEAVAEALASTLTYLIFVKI